MKGLVLFSFITLVIFSCKKDPMVGDTVLCNSADVPTYNYTHPKSGELTELMRELNRNSIPGVSLLIRDADGLWMGSTGFSDLEQELNVSVCNIMRIASITKPMVVSTAMKLYENHQLDIDVPISTYLDADVSDNIANAKEATIRQCMNHSSGIYDHVSNLNFQTAILNDPTRKWKEKELVEFAYGMDAYFAPGTSTRYSNINTILVAMCIDQVTGAYHGKMMRDFIFDPLSMASTYYYSYEDIRPQTTHGYFDLYGKNSLVDVSNFNTGVAHTAVYSTVYDLEYFLRALVIDETLLADSTLAEMKVWQNNDDQTKFGLGLFKRKMGHSDDWSRAGIGHTGGEFGYSGKCFYYPDADVTIISLCNYGTNIITDIGNKYHQFHRDVEQILMP